MTTLVLEGDEAAVLATILAARTGETVTEAVTVAMRERLERVGTVPTKRTIEERRTSIEAIQKSVAAHLAATGQRTPTMKEMDDELYDENGLPH